MGYETIDNTSESKKYLKLKRPNHKSYSSSRSEKMTIDFRTGIKATFLVTKKKGMSDEDFEQYHTKIYIPMVAEILNWHRVLYYGVVRLPLRKEALCLLTCSIAIPY